MYGYTKRGGRSASIFPKWSDMLTTFTIFGMVASGKILVLRSDDNRFLDAHRSSVALRELTAICDNQR